MPIGCLSLGNLNFEIKKGGTGIRLSRKGKAAIFLKCVR